MVESEDGGRECLGRGRHRAGETPPPTHECTRSPPTKRTHSFFYSSMQGSLPIFSRLQDEEDYPLY